MKSPLLSRCMFCNIPHLLQSCTLSQLETQDSCIAANQNRFWESMGPIITFSLSSHAQPVPAQAHPEYQSSIYQSKGIDTTSNPAALSDSGDQSSLKEDAMCVHLTRL